MDLPFFGIKLVLRWLRTILNRDFSAVIKNYFMKLNIITIVIDPHNRKTLLQ